MQGAWPLLVALVLAQALSLPFGRHVWSVRLGAGLVLGVWVLAPEQGVAMALLLSATPLLVWTLADAGLRRFKPSATRTGIAEGLYIAVAVSWLAVVSAPDRAAIAEWLAAARSPTALGVLSVYLAAILGGERFVRAAIASFLADLPAADRSALPRAGRVIGWAERFVVITLIAAGYGEPVGWLLAAKTAMRYPEIKEEATGRLGEYFFVGTLLSIAIGVVAGLAIRWLLTHPLD